MLEQKFFRPSKQEECPQENVSIWYEVCVVMFEQITHKGRCGNKDLPNQWERNKAYMHLVLRATNHLLPLKFLNVTSRCLIIEFASYAVFSITITLFLLFWKWDHAIYKVYLNISLGRTTALGHHVIPCIVFQCMILTFNFIAN